jgi:hypothetical protein
MGINLINDNLVAANARVKYSAINKSLTNSTVPIDYDTEVYNFGFVTDLSGNFTIPADGQYLIISSLDLTGSNTGLMRVYVNGVQKDAARTTSDSLHRIQSVLDLVKDDVLSIRYDNSVTMNAVPETNYVSITRIAEFTAGQPAGFGLGSELLYGLNKSQMRFCHIYSTTDQSGNADGATITKIFDSITSDVHGMADLGNNRIVPNLPGVYWIGAAGVLSSISNNTSITHQLYTRINGGGPNFSSARSGNDSSGNLGGAFIHYHYANGIYQFNGTTDYVDVAMTFDTVGGTWNSSGAGEGSGFLIVAYLGPLPSLT